MGTAVTLYLITYVHSGDGSEPVAWRETHEAAERWIAEHPPSEYETIGLWKLLDDGTVEHVEWYQHVPEPYRGELIRARVSMMNKPGYYHRVPIDCARPRPDMPLTENDPWRVIANSCCGTESYHDGFTCHCGDWQEVEGSPEAVAKLADAG